MRHLLRIAAGGLLLLPAFAVSAQTLSSQYEEYLKAKCDNMHFERGEGSQLLPGQAGPNLFAYCTGTYSLPSGGPSISDASLGASGAASASASKDDATLRRRRDRARNAADADAGEDMELLQGAGRSLFLTLDYLHFNQRQTTYQDGRDASSRGASLGFDQRLGTTGLVGLIARYAAKSGDIDAGGDFKSHALGAVLYGSWFPRDGLFVDANASYDGGHATTRRRVAREETAVTQGPSYVMVDENGNIIVVTPPPVTTVYFDIPPALASSGVDNHELDANLLAGYDLALGRFAVGPRAGAQFKSSVTGAFTETGATPMTLAFDEQKQESLRSTLGMQAGMAINARGTVLVAQANIDWVHEYQADSRIITAHFAEDYRPDPSLLRFQTQAPDRDSFDARLSLVAVLPHGASVFLSVASSFGNSLMTQRGATLGVRAEL